MPASKDPTPRSSNATAQDFDTADSILRSACKENSIKLVESALAQGASINLQDEALNTPMHVAAMYGSLQVIVLLHSRGGSITTPNKFGRTAMQTAKHIGEDEAAAVLGELAEGVAVDMATLPDSDDEIELPEGIELPSHADFLLRRACKENESRTAETALAMGADVNATDGALNTPMHDAAMYGSLQVIMLLHEQGATLDARNQFGRTPLEVAEHVGEESAAEILSHLAAGKYVGLDMLAEEDDEIELPEGVEMPSNAAANTSLRHACKENQLKRVEAAITKGANINLQDDVLNTPMHIAAMYGSLRAIVCLHAHGATLNTPNNFGRTPMQTATHVGEAEAAAVLGELAASRSVGINSLAEDDDGIYLPEGVEVPSEQELVDAFLRRAVKENEVSNIERALGQDASLASTDDALNTPMHVAAMFGALQALVYLHKQGAALDAQNKFGRTPLETATHIGEERAAALLTELAAGRSVDVEALEEEEEDEIELPEGVELDLDDEEVSTAAPAAPTASDAGKERRAVDEAIAAVARLVSV